MDARHEVKTRQEAVYRRLRSDILSGRLRPGKRLLVAELRAEYSISAGSLREALSRLMEQGLVQLAPQQGFFVTPLSRGDLVQLTTARVEIESLALRHAVENGDLSWESEVLAAHHRLSGVTPMGSEQWEDAHAVFHEMLLSGCGNHWIVKIATQLRASASLYRSRSFPIAAKNQRDIAGEHRQIVDAVLSRDADLSAKLLSAHIQMTSDLLLEGTFDNDESLPWESEIT